MWQKMLQTGSRSSTVEISQITDGVTCVKCGNLVMVNFVDWHHNTNKLSNLPYKPVVQTEFTGRYYGGSNYYSALGNITTDGNFTIYYYGSGNSTNKDINTNSSYPSATFNGQLVYFTND